MLSILQSNLVCFRKLLSGRVSPHERMTYSLTCEVHDGAAKLELTGVVDLEPVGDRRIAEAPGDSSPVASDLEATETVWSRMRKNAMIVQRPT